MGGWFFFSPINFSGLCLMKNKIISKAIIVDYMQAVDWERNWIWCGDEILDQVD
jgi:hypothetical protein